MSYLAAVRDPQTGKALLVDPLNQGVFVETTELIGVILRNANDPNYTTLANTGAGSSATVANNIATLVSGTANSGSGSIASVASARYMLGCANRYRGIVRLPDVSVVANGANFRWGPHTESGAPLAPQNGFFFSFSKTTGLLSVNAARNGTIITAASGAFNGTVSSYAPDTNVHQWVIVYDLNTVSFYVDDLLLHTMVASTIPLSGEMTLPVYSIVQNPPAGVTTATMENWGAAIVRFGKEFAQSQSRRINTNTTTNVKVGAGNLHRICVCNNPSNTNTWTIYDSTTGAGTVLAVITGVAAVGVFEFDITFINGLTIVSATGATPIDGVVIFD